MRDFVGIPQGRYSLKPQGIRLLVRNTDSSPIIFTLHDPHGELVRVVVSAEVVEAMGLLLSTQGLTFGDWTLASFSFML